MAQSESEGSSGVSAGRNVIIYGNLTLVFGLTAIKEGIDWFISTIPLTGKVGLDGGLSVILDAEFSADISMMKVCSGLLGPIKLFCNVVLAVLGNFQTLILNYVN